MSKKKFQSLYLICIIIPFLMLIFPIFSLANHEKPVVIGLPFPFFWVVLWIVITFIAITILYFNDPEKDKE